MYVSQQDHTLATYFLFYSYIWLFSSKRTEYESSTKILPHNIYSNLE